MAEGWPDLVNKELKERIVMTMDTEGIHEIANSKNPGCTADVVFVHGLDGSSHSTWRYGKQGKNDHFFWPEELGKALPHCAFWSVGYAAGISGLGNPGMIIDKRAGNIANQLSNLGVGERPIVFITHSMGGLVVKALIVAGQLTADSVFKRLTDNIRGIVFCATPHRGSEFVSAAGVLTAFLGGRQKHVKEMSANADQLDLLHDRFLSWHRVHPIPVETYAESIGLFRKNWLGRLVPLGQVVPRSSANPSIGNIHDVDADHLTLVKPSPTVPAIYNLVYRGVERFIETALPLPQTSIPESRDLVDSANDEDLDTKNKLFSSSTVYSPDELFCKTYDLENNDDIGKLIVDFRTAYIQTDYVTYYKLLKKYSLPLKLKGRHRELAEICAFDIEKESFENVFCYLTFSQCKLTAYNLSESIDVLNKWFERDPKLDKLSPVTRLMFIRTYSEILLSNGDYDIAINLLELFISHRSLEKVKFKTLCHSLSVLGRAYLVKGDINNAFDLFEATLLEQNLTADPHGIAIAEMNLGATHIANGDYKSAKELFESAMKKFDAIDTRACAWSQLNLAIAMHNVGDDTNFADLIFSSLAYYNSHSECTTDYLINLEYIKNIDLPIHVKEKVLTEYNRTAQVLAHNRLSPKDIQFAEKAMSVLELQFGPVRNSSASERTVTSGGFKARSILVKSFKKSLDTEQAISFLGTIKSKRNHFAIPFYNDFLVEVCERRKDLIPTHVIKELDNILQQTDSIKLFYARFLEKERLIVPCEILLTNIDNKCSFEYLNLYGNLCSHRGKGYFDKAMNSFTTAVDTTTVEHFKAQVYNNMAHLIHRHHKRQEYKLAIEYCLKAIELRSSVRFYYPSVLMLALKIELANIGDVGALIEKHNNEYGLDKYKHSDLTKRIHDKTKQSFVRDYLETLARKEKLQNSCSQNTFNHRQDQP